MFNRKEFLISKIAIVLNSQKNKISSWIKLQMILTYKISWLNWFLTLNSKQTMDILSTQILL